MATDYNPAQPWVRQPFDTDLSWSLFQEYLALPPPRRLADAARGPGRVLTWAQLETLAWEDGWKERAARWDEHLDAMRIATVEQVVQEDAKARAERQGRAGRKLQRLGELEVDRLIKLLERTPGYDTGTIQVRDAIRAIGIGVRVERLALGDSTEKIDTGPDLSQFSVEELRQLQDLQAKAGS